VSKFANAQAWKAEGGALALVGPGVATPLLLCSVDEQRHHFCYNSKLSA